MKLTPKLTSASQKPRRAGLGSGTARPASALSAFWLCSWPSARRRVRPAADALHAGFLFDEFDLTLAPGHRTEAAGRSSIRSRRRRSDLGGAPVALLHARPDTESKEFDFLYPVMTYDRYGEQYRWQFFQVAELRRRAHAGGERPRPLHPVPALFPAALLGPERELHRGLSVLRPPQAPALPGRHLLRHVPLVQPDAKEGRGDGQLPCALFHLRHGDGLHGWQFWPLVGNEHKEVTTRTNGFGDVKTIGGHDSFFAFWPLFFNNRSGIGTTNQQWQQASLPAYSLLRSPLRDSTASFGRSSTTWMTGRRNTANGMRPGR